MKPKWNLWSNINSEKLVKSETMLFGFVMVNHKEGQNSSKCCERWCAHSSIKWASKSMIKFKFHQVGKKWTWWKLALKEAEITMNMVKVGIHSSLPNGHLNLWLNFNFEKLVKSEISSCCFAKVGLKGVENSLEHHKSWHACFSMKLASKSTITFQFQ